MQKFLEKPAILLTTLYTIAWSPMLLLRADYWDGWILLNQFVRPDFNWLYLSQIDPQRLYHYYALIRFTMLFPDPILVTRIIIFASWLISGLILLHILRRYLKWNDTATILIVLYYLIIPTFFVRFELFLVYYSLANLLFLLACSISLDIYRRGFQRAVREIGAGILFVLSFLVNSFPIFFSAFLAVHMYLFAQQHLYQSARTTVFAWLKRYFYLLILPVAFLAIKLLYFKPFGDRIGYNEPIIFREGATLLSTISSFIDGYWGGMYTGIFWPFVHSLVFLERKYFAVALMIAAVLVFFLFRRYRALLHDTEADSYFNFGKIRISKGAAILVAGVALCFLALFPYVAVGKPPHIYGYGFGLRHSLLFPLGSALFIYGAVVVLIRKNMQKGAHIVLLSLSIAFIWYNFFLLDMDWYKQQAILHELPAITREAPRGILFTFDDKMQGLNWNNRNISHQEYDGYFELLTGTRGYNYAGTYYREVTATSTALITITGGRRDDPRVMDWLYLKYTELFKNTDQLRLAAEEKLQIVLNVTNMQVQ